MIALIEEIAQLIGEAVFLPDGWRRLGKHTWRSTGAVYLTSLGLELLKITMFARWNCPLITHYARLAPLATLGDEFKRGTAQEKKKKIEYDDVKKLNLQAARVKKHMELQIEGIKEEMSILSETIKKVELKNQPKKYLIKQDNQGGPHNIRVLL